VVTLSGKASAANRDKAVQDARKVSGVKSVVDNISMQ
jgi:osmotically-inducible protein OsmY